MGSPHLETLEACLQGQGAAERGVEEEAVGQMVGGGGGAEGEGGWISKGVGV